MAWQEPGGHGGACYEVEKRMMWAHPLRFRFLLRRRGPGGGQNRDENPGKDRIRARFYCLRRLGVLFGERAGDSIGGSVRGKRCTGMLVDFVFP